MNRIRFLRVRNALKQEELARIIHVSQSSLSGYENEKYEPDKKTLLKLASYFGVTVDYLLGIDNCIFSENNPLKKIPVYKHLRGVSRQPSTYILYDLEISRYRTDGDKFFGLQMFGDSMEPRIFPGDVIIARRQSKAGNGDIAVFQIEKGDATIRRMVKYETGITLIPYNPMYSPVSYTNDEICRLPVVILGKAVEIRGQC